MISAVVYRCFFEVSHVQRVVGPIGRSSNFRLAKAAGAIDAG